LEPRKLSQKEKRRIRRELGPKRVKEIRQAMKDYAQATEKKAWRLRFAEGILEGYLSDGGRVEYDLRKYSPGSHEFTKGQIIEGHFAEGYSLLLEVLEDTKIKTFKDITKEEYRQWGVKSRAKMMEIMRGYYPDLKPSDRAALNTLRLARINDRPIADFITDIPHPKS